MWKNEWTHFRQHLRATYNRKSPLEPPPVPTQPPPQPPPPLSPPSFAVCHLRSLPFSHTLSLRRTRLNTLPDRDSSDTFRTSHCCLPNLGDASTGRYPPYNSLTAAPLLLRRRSLDPPSYFTRMTPALFLLLALMSAGTLVQVHATGRVTALYGDIIVIPCNDGASVPEDLMFIKWKYEKDDGTPGDLLIKQVRVDQPTIQATDDYAGRISTDEKSNLLISLASLEDQRTFTCMVVSDTNLQEFPVTVVVYKKPSSVQILDKAEALQKDKPTMVGTCLATDSNPAAALTWKKNGHPLVADGKAVVITSSIKLDPATGLSTASSMLQYVATKDDAGAVFSCHSQHELKNETTTLEPIPIHYPSEKVSLQIMPRRPIVEGDNVTLKCQADGNPPPSSFYFHIKGQKILVENTDTYTLAYIKRDAAGEYKCSLTNNEKLEASETIAVGYLDLSLSPTGKVVKKVGDTLTVKMEKSTSGDAKVSWTKNGKSVKEPKFSKLTFADAGLYLCEVTMVDIARRQSFELVVEGKPVITSLTKRRADDAKHEVLTCEAEGVPEPSFQWSVNSTHERSSYVNGKATHIITVVPKVNLTVSCSVSNRLGDDVMTINVSSVFMEEKEEKGSLEDSDDQAKLIVGVVAGLLIAAAVVGLIYWLYMKNSRQGSWKTGEKEVGTSEESKKLEENNHTV